MPSLWFVVPVHGRLPLAAICLRQLSRTCGALNEGGVKASAVVISDADSLTSLRPEQHGFATIERDNKAVGRRFNDGIQLATDPRYNPNPVDFVVPCGSDDWVDHRLFLEPLPPPDTIFGFQWLSFVREDGKEISFTFLNYEAGAGIRIIPRELVAPLEYRPCDDDRLRDCDTSTFRNLRLHHGDRLKVKHWHLHNAQIVDWKTDGQQLNSYTNVTGLRRLLKQDDPFTVLAEHYPSEALEEMERYYHGAKVLA